MKLKLRHILVAWKKALVVLAAVLIACLIFVVGAALWAFEVKLKRWPVIVYGAAVSARVGDEIDKTGLLQRLERLGYVKSAEPVPQVGEWTKSPTSLDVHFKHCPLQGEGIISGPVSFTMDSERIRAIHLMRSLQDVEHVVIEPELLTVIPASGWSQELTRPVSLEQIPPLLVDAIVLTEDKHFFSHSGIDVKSIFRALEANIKAWRYRQGGSTITQQLIKMTLLSPKKTLLRKTTEISIALAAELFYSKRTILEAYLNRLYYGHWGQFPIRGVKTAAERLFGKSLKQLDVAECALLAAVIRAPNIITPLKHPERARGRRNMVLGLLFKEGKISRDDYEQALAAPVHVRRPGASPVKANGFLDLVKEELDTELGGYHRGQTDVVTSLDPVLQSNTYRCVKKLGSLAQESYVVLTQPETGALQVLMTPESPKWNGEGGTFATVLPVALLPALMPEKNRPGSFTLTSQVFAPGGSSRPTTLREAFRGDRPMLIRKILDIVDRPKIMRILKELGIDAASKNRSHITISPISPLQMAHVYSVMAAGGASPPITACVKIVGGPRASSAPSRKTTVSCKPELLFLVNHLLKGIQPPKERLKWPEPPWLRPAVFVQQDEHGLWGVAYRPDKLLLMRIPGTRVAPRNLRAIMLATLPPTRTDSGQAPPLPEGIVFANICLDSGLRATSICSDVVREPFLRGSQPTDWCPLRHDIHTSHSERR